MERRVFIVLNDGEKMILHQAANIMNTACGLADNVCKECPFSKACENLQNGFSIEDFAEDLLKL